jgi:hypothetical protein
MEDNLHHFTMTYRQQEGRVVEAQAQAHRHPYTTCPEAGPALAQALVSQPVAVLDSLRREVRNHQCTHLLDMSRLAARHAGRGEGAHLRYEATIEAGRDEGPIRATLVRDGTQVLCWTFVNHRIDGPAPYTGLVLDGLAKWAYAEQAGDAQEATLVLMRAAHIGHNYTFLDAIYAVRHAGEIPNLPPTCYSNQQGARAEVVHPFHREHHDAQRLLRAAGP